MPRNPDLNENSAGRVMTTGNTGGNGTAPQPTSTIGAPEPPPEVIEATGGSGAVTIINPLGPDNRLDEGGIVFAYPDLVYSQFIDTDTQIEVTDDSPPGTLILQIPYHPISDYTNNFIKTYCRFHNRYNGDIIFRFQIIGNAMFSGTFCFFWWPRKYPTKLVKMEDAMKYAYKTQSVQMNSVEEYVLKDARQYLYYRDMAEIDIDSRPHLCMFVHTSVVNPLRVGVKVRIRVGSKLASASAIDRAKGAIPFVLADPVVIPNSVIPGDVGLNGRKLFDVFPHMVTYFDTYKFVLDGSALVSTFDESILRSNFNYDTALPCLAGGEFPSKENKRLYVSSIKGWVPTTSRDLRIVYVVHNFPKDVELAIADTTEFSEQVEGDNWLTKVANMTAIAANVKINVRRSNTTELVIYKDTDTDFVSKIVAQHSCICNYGQFTVFALLVTIPSNDIKYGALCGIPNIATGSKLKIPHSSVLGPLRLATDLNVLPSTWRHLAITRQDTSVINNGDELAQSMFTEGTFLTYFNSLSHTLTEDQCLQWDFVDLESSTRVATVRYLPRRWCFTINPSDTIAYRQYPNSLLNLAFANFGTYTTASSFPITDITNWPSRLASSVGSLILAGRAARANSDGVPDLMHSIAGALNAVTDVIRQPIRGPSSEERQPVQRVIKPKMMTNMPSIRDYFNQVALDNTVKSRISEGVQSAQPDIELGMLRPFQSDFTSAYPHLPSITIEDERKPLQTPTVSTPNVRGKWKTLITPPGSKPIHLQPSGPDYMTIVDNNDYDEVADDEEHIYEEIAEIPPPVPTEPPPTIDPAQVEDYLEPIRDLIPDETSTSVGIQTDKRKIFKDWLNRFDFDTFGNHFSAHFAPIRHLSLHEIVALTRESTRGATANAAAIAGALIGGGLSGGLNWIHDKDIMSQQHSFEQEQNQYNWQKKMEIQGNMFNHDNEMQQNSFAFQKQQQQNSFAFQNQQQQNKFQQENKMQSNSFQHDVDMTTMNQTFQNKMSDKTFGQNKTLAQMNITGNLENTALSGGFGIAGNLLNTAGQIYMQNKAFANQQKLVSTQTNAQMQARGQASPILSVAG
nr:MAG: hypothetical protein [Sanya orius sauteri Solinvi-like virus 1]